MFTLLDAQPASLSAVDDSLLVNAPELTKDQVTAASETHLYVQTVAKGIAQQEGLDIGSPDLYKSVDWYKALVSAVANYADWVEIVGAKDVAVNKSTHSGSINLSAVMGAVMTLYLGPTAAAEWSTLSTLLGGAEDPAISDFMNFWWSRVQKSTTDTGLSVGPNIETPDGQVQWAVCYYSMTHVIDDWRTMFISSTYEEFDLSAAGLTLQMDVEVYTRDARQAVQNYLGADIANKIRNAPVPRATVRAFGPRMAFGVSESRPDRAATILSAPRPSGSVGGSVGGSVEGRPGGSASGALPVSTLPVGAPLATTGDSPAGGGLPPGDPVPAGVRTGVGVVLPNDNRVKVPDTTQPPFKWVGQLHSTWPNGVETVGTAVLIDGTHLLTCAHNVQDRANGFGARQVVFTPGGTRDAAGRPTAPFGTAGVRSWRVPQQYMTAGGPPPPPDGVQWSEITHYLFDFAVCRLDRDLGASGFRLTPVTQANFPIGAGRIVGYSGDRDRSASTMFDRGGQVNIDDQEDFVSYLMSTFHGDSGAPVFCQPPNQPYWYVLGVHVTGVRESRLGANDGLNFGPAVNQENFDLIRQMVSELG